jgi:hypothetical protein
MPRTLTRRAGAALLAGAFAWPVTALAQEPVSDPVPAAAPAEEGRLPDGLFDKDRAVRVTAIEQVEREGNRRAVGKLADLARYDAFADVRAAACRALGTLEAKEQLELLVYLAAYDANADVRAAAARSVRRIEGQPEPEPERPIFAPETDAASAKAEDGDEGGAFPMPSILQAEAEPVTRHFALGFGSMGGFGIAAFDVRGRIATGSDGLPWVGFEIGGGWTPPTGYQIVSGLTEEITDDDIRWKLISGAAGLLLYFHRWHYVPIRGGFDPGQGPYAVLGYGFEHLNDEGFFSWGIEVGLLYHPVVKDWIGNVTDCDGDACEEAVWPVIPYIRFSLHFYLV